MRSGQNPAKSIEYVSQPERVTVAVTTYIPFLSGYYAHSLDVLKVCLGSIIENSDLPFDLMVFDNASCDEVRKYLEELKKSGLIQYLVLSQKNLGKVGAWNMIFGAAPGELIAYADSDVYHYPGWLSKHIEVFDTFPEAVTVAGLPRRGDLALYTRTLTLIHDLPDAIVEQGHFINDDWIIDHARSLGKSTEPGKSEISDEMNLPDTRVTRKGVAAYATGTHFQFMVRASVVRRYLPFPSNRPMGENLVAFDQAMDKSGFIRLSTEERVCRHIGNNLEPGLIADLPISIREQISTGAQTRSIAPSRQVSERGPVFLSGFKNKFYSLKPVKRSLLWLYNRIFRIYYTDNIRNL